jgi:broad specificity phosphatase PhoE
MTRILLIRHGSTDLLGRVLYGRMPGILLNAEGRTQAEKLAFALNARYKLNKIVSSPLERAAQTAELIANSTGIAISIDEGITEVDSGSWTGKTFDGLNALDEWQRYNRRRSLTSPPGGETMMNVQSRSWKAIRKMIDSQDSSSATLALVTHGDVIRCLLLLFLGMSIDHIHRLEIAPASLTEVILGPHGPVLNCLNQVFY